MEKLSSFQLKKDDMEVVFVLSASCSSPSPRTRHWKRAASPSRVEVLLMGAMTTGGATVAAESGDTTSDTVGDTETPGQFLVLVV